MPFFEPVTLAEELSVSGLSSEVICTIITVAGVILSAFISHLTSRSVARNETERIKASWKREDDAEAGKIFEDMLAATVTYINDNLYDTSTETLSAIVLARSQASPGMAALIDQLYKDVQRQDREAADITLSHIVKRNRSPE